MGLEPGTWAAIAAAVTSAAGTGASVVAGKKRAKEGEKHEKERQAEARKKKEQLALKGKSPAQRLMGGRPLLG